MTVRSELFRGDVAQARAVAGVPVDPEAWMLDAGKEGGEVCGVEIGFEMQLDTVRLCDGERALQHVDYCLLLILRRYFGSRIPPLTMSLRWITPSARRCSATTSGVPPERAISSTLACTSRSEEHTSELQSL